MHWLKVALLGATMLTLGPGFAGAASAQDSGGSTYPGPYYLGSPDAPVVLEEYADFQ